MSNDSVDSALRYGALAEELRGGSLDEGVKALAREGMVRMTQADDGWSRFCPALAEVAASDPILAMAAGLNALAADMIARWATCQNMEIFTRVNHGEEVVVPVGDGSAPRAARQEEGEGLLIDGEAGPTPGVSLATRLIVVAGLPGGACLVHAVADAPGVEVGDPMQAVPLHELAPAPVAFREFNAGKNASIGPLPLPDAEPEGFLARRSLLLAAVAYGGLSLDLAARRAVEEAANAVDGKSPQAGERCHASLKLVKGVVNAMAEGEEGPADRVSLIRELLEVFSLKND